MKKILFANHEEIRNGATKILFDVAKSMKAHFDVTMASKRKASMHAEFKREFGTILYAKQGLKNIIFSRSKEKRAKNAILKVKPDLVYANTIACYEYAFAAKKLGIKTIMHVHELGGIFSMCLRQHQIDIFPSIADLFIADSEKVYSYLVNSVGCIASKVVLVHEFTSSEEVNRKKNVDDVVFEINRSENQTVLIGTGTVHQRKGVDIAIEAMEILKQKGDYRFIWVGHVGDHKMQELVDRKALSDRFLFLGEKENPYPYMQAADIFVMCSREEPFGIVVLEAMALGKPVISFKNAGVVDAVGDSCFVVEHMTAEGLSEAILKVSGDKKLQASLSAKGIEKQRGFDAKETIPRIKALIDNLIE